MDNLDRICEMIKKAKNEHDVDRLEEIINKLDEICDSCDCTGESIKLRKQAKTTIDQVEFEENQMLDDELQAWDNCSNYDVFEDYPL